MLIRKRLLAVATVALSVVAVTLPATSAAAGRPQTPAALLFATNNTSLITDPTAPRERLVQFGREVTSMIRRRGGVPRGSRLLNGVFYSSVLSTTLFERSRVFAIDGVTARELRRIAQAVRTRYEQQSVLTFRRLRRRARAATAILLEVPGVRAPALRDELLEDPAIAERLGGGSVTIGGRLLLVAARGDLALARRLARRIGGDMRRAVIRYGKREFVSAPAAPSAAVASPPASSDP